VPCYTAEKESDEIHWFEKDHFRGILSAVVPPPADVQKFCSALLLPLLRSSSSIDAELTAHKIENCILKGCIPDVSLLPRTIAALSEAFHTTATEVALVLVTHVLPLARGACSKLHVLSPLTHSTIHTYKHTYIF
jgi:hypothetical protein